MCTGALGETAFQVLGSSCTQRVVPEDGGALKPVSGWARIYLSIVYHHGVGVGGGPKRKCRGL